MESYLLDKYDEKLKAATSLMEQKTDVVKRKVWADSERKAWLNREPICKICKHDYTKTNPITKEHVHPLALGGTERSDNIEAICERCNAARNKVMYGVLSFKSISDLRKRWPANKTSVYEFIVWCHVSIYGSHEEMDLFSHINESFGVARNIQYPIEKGISEQPAVKNRESLFGRMGKLWKQVRIPIPAKKVVKTSQVPCPECSIQLSFPAMYYGKFRCPGCGFKGLFTDDKIATVMPTLEATDDGFRDLIFRFIDSEPITLNKLGNLLKTKFREEGHEDVNTTEILEWFGYPKGLKKALYSKLGEDVVIDESNPSLVTIRTAKDKLDPIVEETVFQTSDEQVKSVINDDKFRNLVLKVYSNEPSHLVYSVLSFHKLRLDDLMRQINERLSDLRPNEKSVTFFDVFSLSKRGGFRKHIIENYSDYILLSQDPKNENIWFAELRYSNYLTDIRESLLNRIDSSGSTQLSAFECWEIIKSRRDAITDISTYEFWRRLGIPGKGTSLLKVWRVIERLDQNYNAVDFFVEGTEAMISFDS